MSASRFLKFTHRGISILAKNFFVTFSNSRLEIDLISPVLKSVSTSIGGCTIQTKNAYLVEKEAPVIWIFALIFYYLHKKDMIQIEKLKIQIESLIS